MSDSPRRDPEIPELDNPEFLRRLLDALPVGVYVADRDGPAFYWNATAEHITGFTSGEIGAASPTPEVTKLIGEFTLDEPSPVLGRPRRVGMKRKDGRGITVVQQWTRLTSPSGRPYVLHAFCDVTENVIDEDSVQIVNQLLLEAAQRMQSQANTDGLTGLLNHRAFHERLRQEISRMRRHGRPLSLIMFDVDFFKKCNDAYGHQFGDRVLVALSETTRQVCRQEDIVARYGGEEFCVVLPDTGTRGAVVIAERLRASVENAIVRDGDIEARVTISCGVATASPTPDTGPVDLIVRRLIQQADGSLYEAKHGGRNKVVVAKSLD
jgi:diguanylate cyclase (GGDEF)-like protein/PAS domain S-box-containing protein